jgi:hypothetical protein
VSGPALPKRRQITVPLLRRESIGGLYHVLTFEDPEEAPRCPVSS